MHFLTRDRMLETEHRGMQGLAAESLEHHLRRLWEFADRGFEAFAIGLIAEKRMADMSHVHADLMGAAGLEPAAHKARKGRRAEIFLHLEMSYRLARACAMGDAHLLARSPMTADRRIDRAAPAFG